MSPRMHQRHRDFAGKGAENVLTAAIVMDAGAVHVVDANAVPNPNWLRPGIPGADQQAFGDDVSRRHAFVTIPSAASIHAWTLTFEAQAGCRPRREAQESPALD